MRPMTKRDRRLFNTHQAMEALAARVSWAPDGRPRFEFTHNGKIDAEEYPDTYQVTLRVKGLKQLSPYIDYSHEHIFTIYLPAGYPVDPPLVRWHTPIVHPNIRMFDENHDLFREMKEEFGSEQLLVEHINRDPRWSKVLDGHVCLNTLKEDWTPFVGLDELVIELANMVRYQKYSIHSAYNQRAAQWAQEQEQLRGALPLDAGLLEVADLPMVRVIKVDQGTQP